MMRFILIATLLISLSPALHAIPKSCFTPIKPHTTAQHQDASHLAIYALLSHNSYPRQKVYFPLPNNWQNVFHYQDPSGLSYQIYEKQNQGKLNEVVLVFRGTEQCRDWLSGHFSSEQFNRARQHIQHFAQRYPTIQKTATGHSLGGTLALFAANEIPGINAVAFNSTPRNHHPFPLLQNRRLIVNEKGDFAKSLSNLWFPWRWTGLPHLNSLTLKQYDFVPPSLLKTHSSEAMAMGLLRLGSQTNHELAVLYRKTCQH